MMIGPMKRKVVTSVVITAIVLIIIFVGISVVYIMENNKEKAELRKKGEVVQRYVLTKDLLAGDTITAGDIIAVDVKGESAPSDSYPEELSASIIGRRLKVNAKGKTIVTESLFYDVDGKPDTDTRLQEYNMITLPSDLVQGDYIDVRIRFATGEDYSVIVGKKIESVGALKEQSNTIFLRLSEEEINRMSSAIIETYINTGVYLYANKYIDPSNQLYSYEYVDLVQKYKDARIVKATEVTDEANASGEVATNEPEKEVIRTDEEIAYVLGVPVSDIKNIAKAIEENDKDTLDYYSNKMVKTSTAIKFTYPVKIEVANLIKSNPNIIDDIKAKYNVEELITQRANILETSITKKDEYTGEIAPNEEKLNKIKENIDKEIEVQRTERQEYLLSLLSKQNTSDSSKEESK